MDRLLQPRCVVRTALFIIFSCLALDKGHGASIALDSGFIPASFTTPDYPARSPLLPDGSYVLFFNVNTLVDQPASAITHYFADGTFDTAYNFPRNFDSVEAVASLPDGRLIASGNQVVYGFDELTEHIIRVNLDG